MKATTTLNLALVAAMFCMAYNLRCANVVLLTASSTGAMRATAWTMSWMTISHQVGAFLSALSLWPLSMIFGRKPLLMTAVVAAIISGILGAASTSVYYLFVSYGLSGISSGVTYIIASLWIVENSPVKIRGQRLILINIGVCLGSAVGEWINFGVAMSSASYRIPFGLQFVFQIPTLVLIYLAPESYRWLLNHGQADRANFVLNALEQNLKTADGGSYLQELQQHQSSCTNSPGILSCFSRRLRSGQSEAGPLMGLLNVHPRRRFLLIIGAQLIPGLCGLMTASYYLGRAINGIQYSPTTGTAVLTSFLPTFGKCAPGFAYLGILTLYHNHSTSYKPADTLFPRHNLPNPTLPPDLPLRHPQTLHGLPSRHGPLLRHHNPHGLRPIPLLLLHVEQPRLQY